MTLLGNFVRTREQGRCGRLKETECDHGQAPGLPSSKKRGKPMSMKAQGLEPIPEETRRLVERSCPKGTMVTHLRDALGPIYSDEHFAHLFPKRGRAAEAPWRLALVTVLQVIEGLSDRQAAEYVHTRVDWLYALALPLDDPGFDYSILSDFRQRLLSAGAQELILEPILQLCRERGSIRAGGKQRTDATAVLAQVRSLN